VPRYSDERKEAVLRKMLPPHNRSLSALAAEEGTSEATLYNWRRAAPDRDRLLPDGATGPDG
jgi:transposase-like protein